jgi:hypothetical protein
LLGRLPDGLASEHADTLLPSSGGTAVQCLVQRRLAFQDAGRLRMLAPVRDHAASIALEPGDLQALHDLYFGFAALLRRYLNGDYRGVNLPRLRVELVNIEALIVRATDPDGSRMHGDGASQRELGSLAVAVGAARRERGQLALTPLIYIH